MSIHAQITDDARAALAAQKRVSTISSIIVAIMACVLIGLVLMVIALAVEVKRPPELISYTTASIETEVEQPEVVNQVVKPPSAPSVSLARVIASNSASNLSVPTPDVDAEAVVDLSDSLDFTDDFAEMSWDEEAASAAAASFFGQKVEAQRIAYVIDYSLSMKGKRDKLMRKELAKAVNGLSSSMDYQMIYFAGPVWVAGDKVDLERDKKNKKKWKGMITDSDGKEYRWSGNGPSDWSTRTQRQQAQWQKATASNISQSVSNIKETPLVYGTEWEKPLRMALNMEPAPEVIYFMTDGLSRRAEEIARTMGSLAKRKGVKVNTIAMMVPSAKDAMGELAQRTGGQFSIVNEDGSTTVEIKATQ